jgi:TPR repeat protein
MIKCTVATLACMILSFCSGCAQTPGDAALRGGHPEAAASLYLKGAELGHGDAALKLGLLVENGTVSGPQYGTAVQWYLRACEAGELAGCHNAGVGYEYGKLGASKDMTKAYEYYLKAAERGYMQSQYNLSSLYSNQYVQPQNDFQGYLWMVLAQNAARQCRNVPVCEWVLEDPPGHKAKLKSRLAEAQVKEAEKLAASWTARK